MARAIRILVLLAMLVAILVPSLPARAQSTVDGDTQNVNVWVPRESRSFDAAGLQWVFYSDGTNPFNIYYRTSDDYGATWSNATLIGCAWTVSGFDVWFDGTYLHYILDDCVNVSYRYRRGMPLADGSITWSAAEQEIPGTTSTAWCSIAVDTSGCAWVSSGPGLSVKKNANNDGTWSTERTDTISANGLQSKILPLTDDKMAIVYYNTTTHKLEVRRWTTVAWGTAAAAGTTVADAENWDCVAQDDDVHVVWYTTVNWDCYYAKYQYSINGWSAATNLADDVGADRALGLLIYPTNNDLYFFYEGNTGGVGTTDHIYYRRYDATASTWETAVDWVDETIADGVQGSFFMVQEYPAANMVGLYYVAGAGGAPYILKYDRVEGNSTVDTLQPSGLTGTQATLRADILTVGTGTITSRGFRYRLDGTATWTTTTEAGSFGVGVYSDTVTGLETDELYEVQAVIVDTFGTHYGDVEEFITVTSGGGTEPDQPDEPGSGMHPPVPTTEPGGWFVGNKTYNCWIGSDVINSWIGIADMSLQSFVWTCIMMVLVVALGLLLCKFTRHLGITFIAVGILLGLFAAPGCYLDWWILLPYLVVGIALVVREYQYSW